MQKEAQIEDNTDVLSMLGLMLIVSIPVIIFNESQFVKQTLHPERLLIGAVVIGVGGGLIVWWKKFRKAEDVETRYRSLVVSTLITALLFPGLALFTNRLLSPFPILPVAVIFEKETIHKMTSETGYHNVKYYTKTYFNYKGKSFYIENIYSPYSGAIQGDTILAPMQRGLYGIYFFKNGIGDRRLRDIDNKKRALHEWLYLKKKAELEKEQ